MVIDYTNVYLFRTLYFSYYDVNVLKMSPFFHSYPFTG